MTSLEMPLAPLVNVAGVAARRVAKTNRVAECFFHEQADAIASTCQHLAQKFQLGGRVLVCGDGAQASDVAHVVVEFMHPVVVGKRALPAMPLPEIASGAALRTLPLLGREHDILMLISSGALTGAECELLYAARAAGLTTIALCGATAHDSTEQQFGVAEQSFRAPEKTPGVPSAPGAPRARHHVFIVPCDDACIVQETHEMLYHVLWELVHVFFEHRAG